MLEGQLLISDNYRSLPQVPACAESCGTGDIISSNIVLRFLILQSAVSNPNRRVTWHLFTIACHLKALWNRVLKIQVFMTLCHSLRNYGAKRYAQCANLGPQRVLHKQLWYELGQRCGYNVFFVG